MAGLEGKIALITGAGGMRGVGRATALKLAGLGADVAMEAVGIPATFEMAVEVVRPGGHVANIGVHGAPVMLHLEDIWIRDLTITTGLVDTFSTPTLAKLASDGLLDPAGLITHRFSMNEFAEAYDVFSGAADSGALKVVVSR